MCISYKGKCCFLKLLFQFNVYMWNNDLNVFLTMGHCWKFKSYQPKCKWGIRVDIFLDCVYSPITSKFSTITKHYFDIYFVHHHDYDFLYITHDSEFLGHHPQPLLHYTVSGTSADYCLGHIFGIRLEFLNLRPLCRRQFVSLCLGMYREGRSSGASRCTVVIVHRMPSSFLELLYI